ncbi:hypothetical protein GDO81_007324 [Engystomops pustulosus]|uniref:Uncharacterized protein n=1 Tax=Engystomops pustulosus TaxID=76066 RepID=A0AAV7C6M1_ENGPU|nr:hypothetical protein GDO81_007324 [Engystomops pustulosus]
MLNIKHDVNVGKWGCTEKREHKTWGIEIKADKPREIAAYIRKSCQVAIPFFSYAERSHQTASVSLCPAGCNVLYARHLKIFYKTCCKTILSPKLMQL